MKRFVSVCLLAVSFGAWSEDAVTGAPSAPPQDLKALKKQRAELDDRIDEAMAKLPPVEIKDYVLKGADGKDVKLSSLFGDKKYLVVVHNMGSGCNICTAYAMQYKGAVNEKSQIGGNEQVAAFCLLSVDEPKELKIAIEKNGWKFNVASSAGSTIKKDLGFELGEGKVSPGVSVLKLDGDKITAVAQRKYFDGDRILGLLDTIWLIPQEKK